jgi:hypothetical protein
VTDASFASWFLDVFLLKHLTVIVYFSAISIIFTPENYSFLSLLSPCIFMNDACIPFYPLWFYLWFCIHQLFLYLISQLKCTHQELSRVQVQPEISQTYMFDKNIYKLETRKYWSNCSWLLNGTYIKVTKNFKQFLTS